VDFQQGSRRKLSAYQLRGQDFASLQHPNRVDQCHELVGIGLPSRRGMAVCSQDQRRGSSIRLLLVSVHVFYGSRHCMVRKRIGHYILSGIINSVGLVVVVVNFQFPDECSRKSSSFVGCFHRSVTCDIHGLQLVSNSYPISFIAH